MKSLKPKHWTSKNKRSSYIGGVSTYLFESTKPIHFEDGSVYVDISDKFNHPDYDPNIHGRYIRIGSVLSEDKSNAKLAKSAANTEAKTLIYYGAPAMSSGIANTCSHATKQCIELCLNTSGNGRYDGIQLSRIAKTRLQTYHPEIFYAMVRTEIEYYLDRLDGKEFLAIRPNGTTDQFNDHISAIIDDFPQVQFYDYTAVPSRLTKTRENYHVTLSRKETKANHNWLREHYGVQNVAIVVTKELKNTLLELGKVCGISVVDFDTHDLRLPSVDGTRLIGLLTPKGKARGKESGFIVSTLDQLETEITRTVTSTITIK